MHLSLDRALAKASTAKRWLSEIVPLAVAMGGHERSCSYMSRLLLRVQLCHCEFVDIGTSDPDRVTTRPFDDGPALAVQRYCALVRRHNGEFQSMDTLPESPCTRVSQKRGSDAATGEGLPDSDNVARGVPVPPKLAALGFDVTNERPSSSSATRITEFCRVDNSRSRRPSSSGVSCRSPGSSIIECRFPIECELELK